MDFKEALTLGTLVRFLMNTKSSKKAILSIF